jgi:hypothetical protein
LKIILFSASNSNKREWKQSNISVNAPMHFSGGVTVHLNNKPDAMVEAANDQSRLHSNLAAKLAGNPTYSDQRNGCQGNAGTGIRNGCRLCVNHADIVKLLESKVIPKRKLKHRGEARGYLREGILRVSSRLSSAVHIAKQHNAAETRGKIIGAHIVTRVPKGNIISIANGRGDSLG